MDRGLCKWRCFERGAHRGKLFQLIPLVTLYSALTVCLCIYYSPLGGPRQTQPNKNVFAGDINFASPLLRPK